MMRPSLGLLLLAASAHAQAQESTLDKVQVTGSRIGMQQAQLSGVGPVTIIDADAIARSGATTLETLLQRLPASAGQAGNQGNAYWTINGYGTTQVNLRGMGINRTLLLLNGRRVVAGGTGANSSVDLSMIPVSLIKRIEVLRDGASAVYGADALAGVVNIITRDAVDGGELTLRAGQTTHGDGGETAADLSWGATGAAGNWSGALHMARQGDVRMDSRVPCPLAAIGQTLVCSGSSNTAGGRARLADGRRVNFNQDPNGNPRSFETYDVLKHGYNSNGLLNAVNPVRRLGASFFGSMPLAVGAEWFNEFLYMDRESEQMASPGTLGVFRPMTIAASDPGNPTGQSLLLERRRVVERGARTFFQHTKTVRVVSGLKGRLQNGWDWNASLNWGRNTGLEGISNVINLDKVDATLDRGKCGQPGAAPCGNYLGLGNLTPAVLDYIHGTIRDYGGNAQQAAQVTLNGELLQLPAGALAFASGAEWRSEKGWRDPDPLVVARAANVNAQDSVQGRYQTREVFAELSAPLLDALRLHAAARYSDYSQFGNHTTFKLGADWQMLPSLKLRANRSSAFRVPTVPELFGGLSTGNFATTDPCNNWDKLAADSVLAQNCRAAGIPTGYRQLGTTVLTTIGGNRQLKPEQADTLTVGLVWTPARAVTLTVDYFDIQIDNAIEAVPGSTKLAACYNSAGLSHVFCGPASMTRNRVTGEIDFLSSQPDNVARQRVSGIDLGGLAGFALAGWRLDLAAEASYLKRFDLTPYPGGATISYAGKITGGRGSFAHWRASTGLTAARGDWSGAYNVQYIGAADDINGIAANAGARAPALAYHNTSIKYAVSKSLALSLGIDNLFDRQAPFIQSWIDANTDTMTYELLGRRWYARLGYRF